MVGMAFQSATALATALRSKKIGCRELLELYLGRVERFNPALNAVVVMDLPGARKRTCIDFARLLEAEYCAVEAPPGYV